MTDIDTFPTTLPAALALVDFETPGLDAHERASRAYAIRDDNLAREEYEAWSIADERAAELRNERYFEERGAGEDERFQGAEDRLFGRYWDDADLWHAESTWDR